MAKHGNKEAWFWNDHRRPEQNAGALRLYSPVFPDYDVLQGAFRDVMNTASVSPVTCIPVFAERFDDYRFFWIPDRKYEVDLVLVGKRENVAQFVSPD